MLNNLDITLIVYLFVLFFIFLDDIIHVVSQIALLSCYLIIIALACWILYECVTLSKKYYSNRLNPLV